MDLPFLLCELSCSMLFIIHYFSQDIYLFLKKLHFLYTLCSFRFPKIFRERLFNKVYICAYTFKIRILYNNYNLKRFTCNLAFTVLRRHKIRYNRMVENRSVILIEEKSFFGCPTEWYVNDW